MNSEINQSHEMPANWRPVQVYVMATICMVLGLVLGYLFRGSETRSSASTQSAAAPSQEMHQVPSLEQMKQMADTKAQPLLAQLKNDPNNANLLIQVARVYESTHQFQEATGYFEKALSVKPKDVTTRTELASCMFYSGNADGAINQLQQSLKDSPKDANSLFNLGMIRWKGKSDSAGAVEAWQQLLKSNPTLQSDKKAEVTKLITEARQEHPDK